LLLGNVAMYMGTDLAVSCVCVCVGAV
jgi:hypothetical protein